MGVWMRDFADWEDKHLSVTSLKLDPKNPRLPECDRERNQKELLEELVENDRVYELAKSIVDNGYFPIEALVAVEEAGKWVVVEGNRRLAALKLMVNPDYAKPDVKLARRFRALSEQTVVGNLKKVRVILAPSRSAAAVYIKNKHTQTNFERWSPPMQARFYRELVDGGMSVAEIAKEYGGTPAEIAEFLQMHEMYQVACSLDLPDEIAAIVRNPRDFPMTNLERLYKYPGVATFLGISFAPGGELRGSIDAAEFIKGYTRIVTDVAERTVTSRTHNTVEQIEDYLKSIAEKPDLKRKGTFDAESVINQGEPETPYESKPVEVPEPKKRTTRASVALIPKSFTCSLEDRRTQLVFSELKTLNVEKYHNAVAVLLRVLLELGVSNYLDKTGKINEILDKEQAKNDRAKDWYPSLRQMLNHIVNNDPDFRAHPLAIKALRQLVKRDDTLLTVETFDAFVHNKYKFPSPSDLRNLWAQLEELFGVLLVEPKVSED
ncbi:MAG: ParB/RepB/Spo0J family partition protein [Coriobacteriia bacterium]